MKHREPNKLTMSLTDVQLAELIAEQRALAKDKGLDYRHFVAVVFVLSDSIQSQQFRGDVERLAWRFGERLRFWLIDTMENPAAADACKVDKAPTTILFKNGRRAARYVGQFSQEYLFKLIDKVISKGKGDY